MTTATQTRSILPALVKAARPFAHKGRCGPVSLRDALVRHDGGSTSVTATDLEIACTAIAIEERRDPESYLVDAATGVPTGNDPMEFPAVAGLAGEVAGSFAISFRDLRRVADHIASVTDTETSRYALGGVLVENPVAGTVAMVGTNGRRLHAATLDVADVAGEIPGNTIIPGRMFAAVAKAVKAAAAAVGIKARQADDMSVTIEATTVECRMTWGTDSVAIVATCKLVEGRFPRWRECLKGIDDGTDSVVAAGSMAAWCREVVKATKVVADRRAVEHVAQNRAAGKRVAKSAYVHPRAVQFSPEGATAAGCDYSTTIGIAVTVKLDPEYVADALAAAADFSGSDVATIRATDALSAVFIQAAWWVGGGSGFLAIVMPMAAD